MFQESEPSPVNRQGFSECGFLAVYADCKKPTSGISTTKIKVPAVRRAVRKFRNADLMDARTYKIGVQFGHMILIVVWHSIPGWWKMLWSGHHTVMWPWRGKCGWHYDDDSNRDKLMPNMELPLQMHEIKLVHHRYLAKPK
jgi:hypothetical protein